MARMSRLMWLFLGFTFFLFAGCSGSTAPGEDGGADGSADAGIDGGADHGPDGDGQVCVPTGEEVCDGVDNNCDGRIDEGACQACRCDYWGVALAEAKIPMPNHFGYSPTRFRNFEVAFDGDGVLAFVTGDDLARKTAPVWFARRALDGSVLGEDRELAPVGSAMIDVKWTGKRWLVAWRQPEGDGFSVYLVALAPAGTTSAGPVKLPGAVALAATADDDIYVVYQSSGSVLVQRFDGTLSAVGGPVALSSMKNAFDARSVGDAVAVTGAGEPGTTKYLALIRAGQLVRETGLMKTAENYTSPALSDSFAAADEDGVLGCWRWAGGVWCRYLSLADGATRGPAFVVSLKDSGAWDVARASCSMALHAGFQHGSGSQGYFVMHHFGVSGEVASKTVDRQWIQPRQTLRLFGAKDGRLIRVLDASKSVTGQLDIAIANMRCREPPPPVTDCGALNAKACGFACGDFCSLPADRCGILYGNGAGRGWQTNQCIIFENCDAIDAPRCQERLAEPQACSDNPAAPYWLIPADCALPK